MIATTTTRCCGLVLVAGLTLPAIPRANADAGQNVPAIPGFVVTWQKEPASTGRLDLTVAPDVVIVSGPAAPVTAYARDDGRVLWTLEHGATVAPVIVGSVVYIAEGRTLGAYTTLDGKALWSAEHQDPVTTIGPAPDGVLVATATPPTDKGAVASAVRYLGAATGQQRWARSIDRPLHVAPVSRGSRAFLSPAAGTVAAWSLETGADLWTIPLGVEPHRLDVGLDRLYVGAADEGFFVIVPESGWVSWRLERAKLIGRAAVESDRLYLAFLDNTLACYDHRGARRWIEVLSGRPMTGPLPADDALILPLTSGVVSAFEKATGAPLPHPGAAADTSRYVLLAFDASADGKALFVVTVGYGERQTLTAYGRAPSAAASR